MRSPWKPPVLELVELFMGEDTPVLDVLLFMLFMLLDEDMSVPLFEPELLMPVDVPSRRLVSGALLLTVEDGAPTLLEVVPVEPILPLLEGVLVGP